MLRPASGSKKQHCDKYSEKNFQKKPSIDFWLKKIQQTFVVALFSPFLSIVISRKKNEVSGWRNQNQGWFFSLWTFDPNMYRIVIVRILLKSSNIYKQRRF